MGLSITLVMLFHCAVPLMRFGNIGVEYFLILSAIGLYYSFKKNGSILHFYQRRFCRILPTYLILAFPFFLIKCDFEIAKTLYNLMGLYMFDGKRYFWFINLIVICYLLFPFYYKLLEKKYGFLALAAIIPCCYFVGAHCKNVEILINRIPVFLLGCHVAKMTYDDIKISHKSLGALGIIAFVIMLVLPYVHFYVGLKRYVYFILSVPTLFVWIKLLVLLPQKLKRMLVLLGGLTLEIYILHENIVGGVLIWLIGDRRIGLLAALPIAILLAYGFSRLLHKSQEQKSGSIRMLATMAVMVALLNSCAADVDLNFNRTKKPDLDRLFNDSNANSDRIDTMEYAAPAMEYIAIFGDIQYYTRSDYGGNIYKKSIDWLCGQLDRGNRIRCVLHTGDVTMNNSIEQYERFRKLTTQIAERIPFVSIIGDHDYQWTGAQIYSRDSTHYSDFLDFPLTTDCLDAQFEEGRMENAVFRCEVQGCRLDLMALEFGPRDEVMEWAIAEVERHPERRYVVMTHEYLGTSGKRRTENLKTAMRLRNTTYNTPDQIWDKLVKTHDNVRCVLCGHVDALFTLLTESNDFDRKIPQIEYNIQGTDYRWGNVMMLWAAAPESDVMKVCILDTQTGGWYDGNRSLAEIEYK